MCCRYQHGSNKEPPVLVQNIYEYIYYSLPSELITAGYKTLMHFLFWRTRFSPESRCNRGCLTTKTRTPVILRDVVGALGGSRCSGIALLETLSKTFYGETLFSTIGMTELEVAVREHL